MNILFCLYYSFWTFFNETTLFFYFWYNFAAFIRIQMISFVWLIRLIVRESSYLFVPGFLGSARKMNLLIFGSSILDLSYLHSVTCEFTRSFEVMNYCLMNFYQKCNRYLSIFINILWSCHLEIYIIFCLKFCYCLKYPFHWLVLLFFLYIYNWPF